MTCTLLTPSPNPLHIMARRLESTVSAKWQASFGVLESVRLIIFLVWTDHDLSTSSMSSGHDTSGTFHIGEAMA